MSIDGTVIMGEMDDFLIFSLSDYMIINGFFNESFKLFSTFCYNKFNTVNLLVNFFVLLLLLSIHFL